jgi:serine/threonine protein phosphatase PrpC
MTQLWSVDYAGASHVGLVRTINEDAWLARPEAGIFAVADGMGGHQRGGLAARMVIDALAALPPAPDARSMRERVELALAEVDRDLQTTEPGEISGSTVVVLLICERHFAVLWAGDSRAYRAGAGGFELMTRDHNMAQVLVDSGELAPEAARGHRLASRITRAVGAVPDLLLEGMHGELQSGDSFLLCSDGLTRHVEDAEIEAVLAGMEPRAAADHLVELTLARGAGDNVTAVVLRVQGVEEDVA